MTPNPDAVKAAAEALDGLMPPCTHYEDDTPILCARCDAEAAVAAAEPILRRQIAAEIRAVADRRHDYTRDGLMDAARIAEGTP